MTVRADIQSLTPGALVELFILDATALGDPTLYRFCNDRNALNSDVVWQGATYTAYPLEAAGFEMTTRGAWPTPRLTVSNLAQTIAALCRAYDDLIGAEVTRIRVLAKYLDAVNFAVGVNPDADPTAELERVKWLVNRKVRETRAEIEFELASPLEALSLMLPRRQVIANVCTWQYRSAECGYTGGPVATANDAPTADPAQDRCGKRLASCKLRFGTYGNLPFGGFPSAGLYR